MKQHYATAKTGSSYLQKVQSQQVFKRAPKGLFAANASVANSQMVNSAKRSAMKSGKPTHRDVMLAKLEVFKKKIEMDEDSGRLGPNNQLIEGSEMPLHFMSKQRDLRLPEEGEESSSESEADDSPSVRSRIPSLAFGTTSFSSRDRELGDKMTKGTPAWNKDNSSKRATATRFRTIDN